ncbi:sugar transferase [Ruegeria sp. HKCCD5849]|nr:MULTISPECIES: sugar transferase [unclassified Ruegeria]NOD49777.1 sugar transferase [Ruegeria sp. HKCCD5849]NOD54121.1 sugar transferase [Ruegeria sp. HKCCD5851]NOD70108.1 sugar transferase [Ruegeria sp. HKCCD7303]
MPTSVQYSGFYRGVGKRIFDIAFTLLAAPFVIPMIALLAVFLAFQGVTPFYWQERVGKNGKIFKMLKIRTMVHDADAVLQKYLDANPEAREEWNRNQKLRDDPRIIKFGTFLRKTSMDELPQFWNVLVGEMSMIGPRPMMVNQQELYPGELYYLMLPGITGQWQVSKRNNSSFAERAQHDTEYWKGMSFSSDLSILVQTVAVVLRGTGC